MQVFFWKALPAINGQFQGYLQLKAEDFSLDDETTPFTKATAFTDAREKTWRYALPSKSQNAYKTLTYMSLIPILLLPHMQAGVFSCNTTPAFLSVASINLTSGWLRGQ